MCKSTDEFVEHKKNSCRTKIPHPYPHKFSSDRQYFVVQEKATNHFWTWSWAMSLHNTSLPFKETTDFLFTVVSTVVAFLEFSFAFGLFRDNNKINNLSTKLVFLQNVSSNVQGRNKGYTAIPTWV